jgi:hypothetical protein
MQYSSQLELIHIILAPRNRTVIQEGKKKCLNHLLIQDAQQYHHPHLLFEGKKAPAAGLFRLTAAAGLSGWLDWLDFGVELLGGGDGERLARRFAGAEEVAAVEVERCDELAAVEVALLED